MIGYFDQFFFFFLRERERLTALKKVFDSMKMQLRFHEQSGLTASNNENLKWTHVKTQVLAEN